MNKIIKGFKKFNENDNVTIDLTSHGAFGGSKNAEYRRSIELLEEVFKNQGIYYALSLLYDMQYDRKDILGMMKLSEPKKKSGN